MAGRRRITVLGAGLWGLFAPPAKSSLREFIVCAVHPVVGDCLAKTIRKDQQYFTRYYRPGLSRTLAANIAQDLGQQTDIDIYLDRHVCVRDDIFRCMMK